MRAPVFRGFSLLPGELVVENGGKYASGRHASPDTEIRPGERRSIATEFKRGSHAGVATRFPVGGAAHNHLPVGSVCLRTTKGRTHAWVKVAEPKQWRKRAIVNWEAARGPLPKGKVVHHKDRDTVNDSIDNLESLTRREHALEHRLDLARAAVKAAEAALVAAGRTVA